MDLDRRSTLLMFWESPGRASLLLVIFPGYFREGGRGQKCTVRHTQTQTGKQMRHKQRERGLQTAGKS